MARGTNANPVLSGPPVPARGEERFFGRDQRDQARAWALAGGIAIVGDFARGEDSARSMSVFGRLSSTYEWAHRHGFSEASLRALMRRYPPRIEVGGALAQELARRARKARAAELEGAASAARSEER